MTEQDLDARLRSWGTHERAAVPAVPALALAERPVRRGVLAPLVAAAAVVATVAGVGVLVTSLRSDEHVVPAGEAGVVPWADLPAVAEAPPSLLPAPGIDPNVRRCRATDLSARYGTVDGATGNTLQWIVLANAGSAACRLEGGVDQLSGFQESVRREIPLAQEPNLGSVAPVLLDPGTAGSVTLMWYGRCDVRGTPKQAPYRDLVLRLLGGDVPVRTDLAGSGISAGIDLGCLPRGAPVSVGPLGAPPPDPTYPHDARADLTVAVDLPGSVVAGETLHYVVRLSNPTAAPIRLDPCPSFLQALGSMKKQSNRLNCAAARDVPAGGEEAFAMELGVPADAQRGAAQLTWLFGFPFGAPEGHDTLEIRNDSFVSPSPPPDGCTTYATVPPCGSGMVVGREYPFVAFAHCELRAVFADGRQWRPVDGPVGEGGNPPPGWGNPGDVGSVVLTAPDVLVYTSSTGQRVELRPERPGDPELPICA